MKRFRLSYGRCGIVGEKRRDLQRHPAVGAAARLERRPEKSRGTGQILQGEPEENRFIGSRTASGFGDASVVPVCLSDGLVEDRRIGRKAGQRELADVPGHRAVVQNLARQIVEPEALTERVQPLRSIHACLLVRRTSPLSCDVRQCVGTNDSNGPSHQA